MQQIIQQKLDEIERRERIKILHCVESGSRAWGFASPDSDYDVRFIYLREKEFYLRLDQTRDVIEWQLDDTLDINGWDVQKTLRLLYTSNPTLFEWNASPIVYRTSEKWKKISATIDHYFMEKHGLYHYLSTAKKNYREHLKGDAVKLKKYFYVLRPLLACRWILDKKSPPPMLFSELTKDYLPAPLQGDVSELLSLKMNAPELGEGKRIPAINEYIERSIDELEQILQNYPASSKRDWGELNKLFLSLFDD